MTIPVDPDSSRISEQSALAGRTLRVQGEAGIEAKEIPPVRPHAHARRKSAQREALSWVITIGLAVLVTLGVKQFLFQPYSIPSESMESTLLVGDRVVVARLSKDPSRGDVVVFERPPNDPKSKPDDPDVLIKRVIAIGGDTVEIKGGKVFINGAETKEGYVRSGAITTDLPLATIAEDELFVMGNNREHSLDGRIFGPIKKSSLVGRAIARIWPLDRLGTL